MPPTDPRWLDATDEVILADLVVIAAHDKEVWRALNPTEALAEDAEKDPSIAEGMNARMKDFMDDEGTQRALQKLGLGAKTVTSNQPRTIRFRGSQNVNL